MRLALGFLIEELGLTRNDDEDDESEWIGIGQHARAPSLGTGHLFH